MKYVRIVNAKCRAYSRSNLFDTLLVLLKVFLKKTNDFEK